MATLVMTPAPGERLLRFVGDRVRFTVRAESGSALPPGWRVLLRTNIGRAAILRREIIHSHPQRPPLAGAAWHDLPLEQAGAEWTRELTLTEPGFFRAKAYAVDPQGYQHWPQGDDAGISVHPDQYRTGNTIYCAFIRMFGETKQARTTVDPASETRLSELDKRGYTVIPPSGKIRDLIRELPFIIDTLGCRVIQLVPVNPTPTTFAKFGRFGSPYASQDLTAIDPALVEFDKRTTGIDQFRELTYATHERGARLFLDMVINHTGWGARLQETHPEWYVRDAKGNFVSPGAWGVTWEDLTELDHANTALWQELADVFLTWCRRGVDGFRCDAGYKVPLRAWRYITARVLDEFPETIFLLEGLGGSWEATEMLLTEGAMQWAYSELFQNYSGIEVASYLEYALRQSQRLGLYVHYSETHDNNRLAERGRQWSLLRNQLCALTSVSGGFGFTCGVEWLAAEKINVHSSRGLSWGNKENLIPELARLNSLLREHPCFFDGATLTRVTVPDSGAYALLRESADGASRVLAVVNTDMQRSQMARFDPALFAPAGRRVGPFDPGMITDLLGQPLPPMQVDAGRVEFTIPAGAAYCLELRAAAASANPSPSAVGTPARFGSAEMQWDAGARYRRARAQAAWAVTALAKLIPPEEIGAFDWRVLADWVSRDPRVLLGAMTILDRDNARKDLLGALFSAVEQKSFANVVTWQLLDARRITLVPAGHWLLITDARPFRAVLTLDGTSEHVQSVEVAAGHIACFAPRIGRRSQREDGLFCPVQGAETPHVGSSKSEGEATLELERYDSTEQRVIATLAYLSSADSPAPLIGARPKVVLLTNGRGGMARLRTDLGSIESKYDCLLGANSHPTLPVDRHILAKRARVWVIADGFVTPLNASNLIEFSAGPPALWRFLCNAGNGRAVEIELRAEMPKDQNTTVLRFRRSSSPPSVGSDLPASARVALTVRVDIEDRSFHAETKHNGGAEHHFATNARPMKDAAGFDFTPAQDRLLRVFADRGAFHPQPEWCDNIAHPVEASRGQEGSGDAYSPGWFELPLECGDEATITATAEPKAANVSPRGSLSLETEVAGHDEFEAQLLHAARAFIVRRGEGKTIIAGYPWFLDWGRDTLICVRGLIAAGWLRDVTEILTTFGRFEDRGTLPNTIFGDNASNRDTSDAPLWFGIACEEMGPAFARTLVDGRRTIGDVLRSIAANYLSGTPNGIRVDTGSGLVWSPSHFTWMDTNYPAGTPREGYPVEIQVLWIRLLRQLDRLGAPPTAEPWSNLADRAAESLRRYFWFEDSGYFADVLAGPAETPARNATPDNALRSNYLFAVSLGLVTGESARRCVDNAARYLVVPGALRSLAPLAVSPPLPIRAADGQLLNDPLYPYMPRYEGDEDTRRKPAYHNGTAWTWTFPTFCEALAIAWDREPRAVAAARSYLLSMRELMATGCAGHLPEIIDGDAPHQSRGCDAQAWGATEALRVWRLLKG